MSSHQNDYSFPIDDSIDQTFEVDFPVKRLLSKSSPRVEQKVAVVEKVDVAESSPPETPKKKTKMIKVLRKKKVTVPIINIIEEPEVESKTEVELRRFEGNVEDFLRRRYVDGVKFSHGSMISPIGRFLINRYDIDYFFDLYCNGMLSEYPIFGITEKPMIETPVMVDIDIKLKEDESKKYGEHLYNEESVLSIIEAYNSVLRDVVEGITDDDLTCVLLEKPIYYLDVGENVYVKNGFHLHYPKLFLDKELQTKILTPRLREIVDQKQVFSYLGLTDSKKIIDSVANNMWLMYGSRKDESMEPYLVSKVFKSNLEELSLEQAFNDYKIFNKDEVAINIKNKVQYYLPRILSIIPFGRTEYCRTIKETVKTAFVSQTEAKRKKIEENRISRNEDGELKYKSDPDGDLNKARKLLPLLKRERAVDYHEWIRVMFCLMNISQKSYEGYELFLEFSSRAENYDEDGCYQAWTSTEFTEGGNKLTLGSLRMWVKEDSPEEYKRLELNHSEHIIERLKYACIYGSHSDYAEFFKYIYGEKNIRILNQNPVKMKFASWNENQALWVIEEKSVLSRLISTNLKPYFEKWNMEQNNKLATCEDSADKESINGVLKSIRKALLNLSSGPFLTNVVNYYCSFDIDKNFQMKLNSKSNLLPIRNNKVMDLQTREIRERDRDDLFSRELEVDYVQDCDYTKNVIPFFSSICLNNDDLVDYHKRFWGYNMTGEISDRSLHILWGVGRNGKSTIVDLFEKIIGKDYFISCSEKVIMNREQSSSTSPELIRLQGARCAVLSETKKDEVLNSERIKRLTGGDNIVARQLYGEEVQFKHQASIMMLTNNKPGFDIDDQAMVDRVKLLPFLARFENNTSNQQYIKNLTENCLDEFFSWFVDGAYEWYNGKLLVPCDIMAVQMKSYINELDVLGQFIEERIQIVAKDEYSLIPKNDKAENRIKRDTLYAMFISYTIELGQKNKLTKNEFYKTIEEKYKITVVPVQGNRYFLCKEKKFVVADDE